ncbi:ATP-dependent acyl-CoA ligase [Phreatobacter aquaticus]|uniref:ATP-dependent acyl-CoA ligase n=1 Tax=Phreatobacter aquaticus TaxID=2570229 RepID=A0A4D7QQS8_9HYPH|nr:AMP-binding protein [Phreatobacter aquaticus]QCK87859.1 ATP-dependent acyl-CoA ligase [Phreatobacter aquaticus]
MTSPHADPRIPPSETCVLRYLLEAQARENADRVYAVFDGGLNWSYADTLREVRRTAAGLAALGVRQDDKVLIWLPHGPMALRVWFAINYLGAVAVPINLAYKGSLLERVIDNSDARLMVAQGDLVGRLADIDRAQVTDVVSVGEAGPCSGLRIVREQVLDEAGDEPPPLERPIQPYDLQVILYTSGTTGPSKGVLCSYLHVWTAGQNVYFLGRDDRYMVNLPLAHVSGVLPCVLMLSLGGSVSIVERFRTDRFWEQINETETTFVILLGAMASFLMSRPVTPAERDNCLRTIILLPFDTDTTPIRQRFGVNVHTSFNMTEICCPIMSAPNPTALGSCGRLRPGFEARIVDAYDCEVGMGEVGELILRSDRPWAFSHGYYKNPEATAEAWRNGWFHTGDGFRRDGDGNFYFVDRLKDTIRRRGENISSFEVEADILAHPAIQEAAVVAVPSDVGEHEVLATIALRPGHQLDPADLIAFLRPRMAHFMVPRFIRIVSELPKTPTLKVEKHLLRKEGLAASGVWDREAAGIKITRES